jgi:Ca2+:H+ antiporter
VSRLPRRVLAGVVLLVVLAAFSRYLRGVPALLAFVIAALALAGLAWTVSFATEQVGLRLGPAVTGVLQSTVGNLPEFFVVLFALQAHERTVAQTALIGSILVNALLVLGLVLLTGAARERGRVMRFHAGLPNDTATLMLIASLTIVLIALFAGSPAGGASHVEVISVVGAAALLVVYFIWMRQYLGGDRVGAGADRLQPAKAERPRLSARGALGLLAVAGVGSAFVSDWFVHALAPTIHQLALTQSFAGIVIIAIAGNAVENASGIYLAYRGRHDLAISVVKNSVAQLAAFLYPLMVLVSLATATRLSFQLPGVWAGALVGTAVLIWQITGDGEATPFEGAALIAVYVVLATISAVLR